MSALSDYVSKHVERGECKCGRCIDVGDRPDPSGHTADLIFFKAMAVGETDTDEFERLTREHEGEFCEADPFDGKEHGYMELGGWLGDQGLALQYMALGSLIGVFRLMTPRSLLPGIADDLALEMAGAGLVTVVVS